MPTESECKCPCHSPEPGSAIMHFMPCCYPDYVPGKPSTTKLPNGEPLYWYKDGWHLTQDEWSPSLGEEWREAAFKAGFELGLREATECISGSFDRPFRRPWEG